MTTKTQKRKAQKAKAASAIDRVANDDQVNAFAKQHGDYVREGNKAAINRGGTPLARWRARGLLSEPQLAAIEYSLRLWDRAGRQSGLVQDLLKITGQQPSSGWAQQDALDELVFLKSKVPREHWSIYENVLRFDEPAGMAGSKLTVDKDVQATAARMCVCFVADVVALVKGF